MNYYTDEKLDYIYRVSYKTLQLVNGLKFDTKENNKKYHMAVIFYKNLSQSKIYLSSKIFFNELNCEKSLISNTVYGRRHS